MEMTNHSRRVLNVRWIPSVDVFFFFQAEDGIRDLYVTGVQTCALPIYRRTCSSGSGTPITPVDSTSAVRGGRPAACSAACAIARAAASPGAPVQAFATRARSEERRVGKEGRARWAPGELSKKSASRDEA